MSKAMLIMDMPENCAKCQFFAMFDLVKNCSLNGKPVEYPNNKRQDWCPLREVPKKVDYLIEYFNDGQMSLDLSIGYAKGWNACIDEILGGGDNEKQCTD